jgi:hypothetical protein
MSSCFAFPYPLSIHLLLVEADLHFPELIITIVLKLSSTNEGKIQQCSLQTSLLAQPSSRVFVFRLLVCVGHTSSTELRGLQIPNRILQKREGVILGRRLRFPPCFTDKQPKLRHQGYRKRRSREEKKEGENC